MLDVFGKIGDAVSGLVTGVFSGIDKIHTSGDEKLQAKIAIQAAEAAFRVEMASLSTEIVKAQADVIKAEINSKHWLAAVWRPVLMLSFGFVILYSVIAPSLGAAPIDLSGIPERFWSLMTVGIGGYVGGRTIEKVAPAIVEGMNARASK